MKVALNSVRKRLEESGTEADALLAPIEDAARDVRGETKSRGAIVILASPSLTRVLRANGDVKPIASVGDHFDIRTLLAMQQGHRAFYILALSQNRLRLLKCTESTSEEVAVPGAPASLADWKQTDQPDHVLDNRVTAGPSRGTGTGVMFGTGSDREAKDEYLAHYFLAIDRAVCNMLNGSSELLIPAGVEHEIALYCRISNYPHVVQPGIHGAPDGLEGGEMHRRALELLDQRDGQMGTDVPADFDKRVGTGHASTHVHEIVAGAFEGRVSNLFLQANASYSGAFDPVRQRVKRSDDPMDSPVDLIDAAAVQTILHGGEVKVIAGSAMPNGVPVCALMRYPAVQNAGAGPAVEAA